MSQQPDLESLSRADRTILAIQAMKSDKSLSQRRAAALYGVPQSTLSDRRAGTASRRDIHHGRSNLTLPEEEALLQRIKDLSFRGFAPSHAYVRSMANQLLAARGGTQVGINWVTRLIQRRPDVRSQLSRPRDYRRVLCSDPAIIRPWFDVVASTKAKYGIQDEDTYNFDETGFQIGLGGTVKVVTASEIRLKPISRQAGNREWITLIAAINAMGWLLPPFFILKAKYHLEAWYHNNPKDWRIGVTSNGWTTNEIGVAWLRHFIEHTTARTVGAYRLLILDGHESHHSIEFQDICKENNIVTLCMPPHASHILQPLDVGCFAPLKRAYKNQVGALANSHINNINKTAFLEAFQSVYSSAFSPNNIRSSFRATGLVPVDPEVVISKLEVKPRTPTPPAPGPTPWQPKTPSNVAEIDSQSTLIIKRIRDHNSSSPDSIIEMMEQFKKGAQMMAHSEALIAIRIAELQAANDAASGRRKRKRRRIQKGGTLTQADAEDLISQRDLVAAVEQERRETRRKDSAGEVQVRRCTQCSEPGHNKRTCKKDAAGSSD
jgi:hypothetical protein